MCTLSIDVSNCLRWRETAGIHRDCFLSFPSQSDFVCWSAFCVSHLFQVPTERLFSFARFMPPHNQHPIFHIKQVFADYYHNEYKGPLMMCEWVFFVQPTITALSLELKTKLNVNSIVSNNRISFYRFVIKIRMESDLFTRELVQVKWMKNKKKCSWSI